MPMRFRFYEKDGDEVHLLHQAILKSTHCEAHTKKGTRCKRLCIVGFEYCPSHLELIKHLKIKKSTMEGAGKGLFAYDKSKDENEIIFKKNERIVDYNGKRKTQEQIDNEYKNYTAPYAIAYSQDKIIDAGDKRGVGSLMNHKPNSQSNVRFATKKQNGQIIGVQLIATKNIRNGQELFAYYGKLYKFDEDTYYETKPYYK